MKKVIVDRTKVEKEFINYKQILIDASENKNMEVTVKVPYSRFRMLISQHTVYNHILLDKEIIDKRIKKADFCKLTGFNNNNIYIIVKGCEEHEENKGACVVCKTTHVPITEKKECYMCTTVNSSWYTTSMYNLRKQQINY